MASGNPSGLDRDPRLLLQKAMTYYSQEKYAKAVVLFTQVANACPCTVQVWKQSCHCKSLLHAIENNTLKDELKKKCICSAKSDRRCKNPTHLDALDSLAAAREKERRLDRVQCDAEMMIALFPRDPKGYLRLGKALRLNKSPNLAYFAYLRGVDLVAEKNPTHRLLPKLRELSDKARSLLRYDPITQLPIELVVMIFKDIGFRSLCRSLRVSKSWKTFLTGHKEKLIRDLWRFPNYTYGARSPQNLVTQSAFRLYSSYSGHQITELTISNYSRFGLNKNKLYSMLALCPHLKSLVLRGHTTFQLERVPDHIRLPRLTRLHLGQGVVCSPGFFHQTLAASASTLEEFSVFEMDFPINIHQPNAVAFTPWPMLDKLKVLRLSSDRWPQPIELGHVMNQTPNVEDAWMYGVSIHPASKEIQPWRKLRSIYLGNIHIPLFDNLGELSLLHPNIQEVSIHGPMAYAFCSAQLLPRADKPERAALVALQKLTISNREPLAPDEFEAWVRPGIASGSLRELDLKPFPFAALKGRGAADWFRSARVAFLGLSQLSAEVGHSIDSASADDALLALVDRFPQLRALDIGGEPVENVTLGRIVQRGVAAIYHRSGRQRDEVKDWAARTHGARIVDGVYAPPHPDQHGRYHDV